MNSFPNLVEVRLTQQITLGPLKVTDLANYAVH